MVDTCTVLAAYSAAHQCYVCCLCFPSSFRAGVLRLVTEIIMMFCGGLRSRLVAPLTVKLAAYWPERRRPDFVGR